MSNRFCQEQLDQGCLDNMKSHEYTILTKNAAARNMEQWQSKNRRGLEGSVLDIRRKARVRIPGLASKRKSANLWLKI